MTAYEIYFRDLHYLFVLTTHLTLVLVLKGSVFMNVLHFGVDCVNCPRKM